MYTVEYTLVVPLMEGSCLIYINLPYPDFNLAVTPVTAIDGFGMTGPSRSFNYVANNNLNQIIITDACRTYFYESSLYSQTFNLYGLKNPAVAKNTAAISMQVWDNAGGQVAQLTTDNSPVFQITEGSVRNLQMTISDTLINSVVTFTTTFTFDHQAVGTLPALVEFTLNDPDVSLISSVALTSTNLTGGSVKLQSATKSKIVLIISNPKLKPSTYYSVTMYGLVLAESV